MLRIDGGRAAFYQWDVNQRLSIEHDDVVNVAFTNSQTSPALICAVYAQDGIRYADVPNILLQQDLTLKVYGCCFDCVRVEAAFKVIARERPAGYVYTETEVKRYDDLERRIATIEQLGPGADGVGIKSVKIEEV